MENKHKYESVTNTIVWSPLIGIFFFLISGERVYVVFYLWLFRFLTSNSILETIYLTANFDNVNYLNSIIDHSTHWSSACQFIDRADDSFNNLHAWMN